MSDEIPYKGPSGPDASKGCGSVSVKPSSVSVKPSSVSVKQSKATLNRIMRYRLVIPIARGRNDSLPTARGVAIGLLFALTPTVGIQMPIIAIIWGIMRWLRPTWRFNLIVALAWTWTTNVLTLPFVYYAYLATGKLILGYDDPFGGFEAFRTDLNAVLDMDIGIIESFWLYTVQIFENWGVPLFVGCVPWAIAGAWLGYVWCIKFMAKFREHHRKQVERRRLRREDKVEKKRLAGSEIPGDKNASRSRAG